MTIGWNWAKLGTKEEQILRNWLTAFYLSVMLAISTLASFQRLQIVADSVVYCALLIAPIKH